jgi:hypothetical protein
MDVQSHRINRSHVWLPLLSKITKQEPRQVILLLSTIFCINNNRHQIETIHSISRITATKPARTPHTDAFTSLHSIVDQNGVN